GCSRFRERSGPPAHPSTRERESSEKYRSWEIMKRVWQTSAAVLGGLLVAAISAMPQAYTVSAKPGAVNYIEGHAFLNGQPLSDKGLRSTFLNANDTLSTDLGKAEILLTPGVFLRIGDNSEIRMVSPSLT